MPDGNSAYEMQPQSSLGASRRRSASGSHADFVSGSANGNGGKGALASVLREQEAEGSVRRSHTTGKKVGEGLKRRFGSLRKSKNKTTDV